MTRPLAIPVEPLAATLAPKPKTLSQPKTDLHAASLDRSAFRASLKEAQSAQSSTNTAPGLKDAAAVNPSTRAETKANAAKSAAEATVDDRLDADRQSTEREPVAAHDASDDEASRPALDEATPANTDVAVAETPDQASTSSGVTRAPASVISADAPPGAIDQAPPTAPVEPETNPGVNRPIDTRPGLVDTTRSQDTSTNAAQSTAPTGPDADASAAQAATSAREAGPVSSDAVAKAALSAHDVSVSADGSIPTRPSADAAPAAGAETRAAVQPTNSSSNTAADTATSAASALRTDAASEQQTATGDDQQRGDARSRDGRSTNIASFAATAAADEAPAVTRADSVDQAVKLSQATGRMPTSTMEGLAGSAAPNSPHAVGARDAGAAQFVPMNATAEEATPFASRVVRGLQTMLNHRGGSMTMRLDPPELGALKVQMTLRDGTVSAMFTAATAKAHALLREHMGTLRASLESQGLNVERLSVQTATTANSNSGANDAGTRHDQSGAQSDRQQSGQQTDAGHGQSRGYREQEERSTARRSVSRSFEQSFEEQLAG